MYISNRLLLEGLAPSKSNVNCVFSSSPIQSCHCFELTDIGFFFSDLTKYYFVKSCSNH